MPDISVDMDQFGSTLDQILEDVRHGVVNVSPEGVKEGLKVGAKSWRSGAPVRTGKYKKSIKWHMIRGGENPGGEIGSPKLPGLPHLLEKGHARIGGGRVPGIPHIAPAAEEAFDATEKAILESIDKLLG